MRHLTTRWQCCSLNAIQRSFLRKLLYILALNPRAYSVIMNLIEFKERKEIQTLLIMWYYCAREEQKTNRIGLKIIGLRLIFTNKFHWI